MKKLVGFSDIIGEQGIFIDGDWVETKDQDPNGNVRLIQLADIGDGSFLNKSSRFLTIEKANELKCTFLEPGDILIARMPDPLGRACVFPGLTQKAVTVVDVCIIRPDQSIVDPNWLKGLINSKKFRNDIQRMVTGTTRQRVSRGNLSTLKFSLPLLSDQIKIATLLKKTEDLIQKRKESITLLDELVKSTFLEMFGDPKTNLKGWPVQLIADSGKVLTGKTPPTSNEVLFNGSIPFITPSDLEKVNNTPRFLSEEGAVFSRVVGVGSTFVCCIGATIGKVGIAYKVSAFNQQINAIEWNDDYNQLFGLILMSNMREVIANLGSSSTTLPLLNKSNFERVKIIKPPKNLQDKFGNIYSKILESEKKLEKSLNNLKTLHNSLSQRAFNGELDLSKVNIDHLLPKEERTNIKQDTIPPTENKTPKKKYEAPEEQRLFFEERKSEMYGFSDGLAKAFGAGKKGQQKLRSKLEASFTSAQISRVIQDHFQGVHFTAEMLMHFLQETKLATVQYTGMIERRENPKIDLVQDIPQVLEEILHITDPDLLQDKRVPKLEQVFYNGKNPEFELRVREEDLEFVQDKTPEQLSGIYFKIKE